MKIFRHNQDSNNLDNFSSIEDIEKYLENQFIVNKKNMIKSKSFFVILNVITFSMSATVVLLTMFIVGLNIGGILAKNLFVSISVLTSFITLLIGINSLFQFKKRKSIYKKRIIELNTIMEELEEKSKEQDWDSLNEEINNINNKLSNLDKLTFYE